MQVFLCHLKLTTASHLPRTRPDSTHIQLFKVVLLNSLEFKSLFQLLPFAALPKDQHEWDAPSETAPQPGNLT